MIEVRYNIMIAVRPRFVERYNLRYDIRYIIKVYIQDK